MRHGLATTNAGEGPPVLLVHGLGGFKESWGRLPGLIADNGRRAVAVDLPGWGESPAPGSAPHSPRWYAARLAPLLADLGPAIVVGHSLGCQASVRLAVARPDLVRGLVLLAPQVVRRAQRGWRPRVPSDWAALPVIGPLATRLLFSRLREDDARLTRAFTVVVGDQELWDDHAEALALLEEAKRRFRESSPRVWGRALGHGLREDLRRSARRLTRPTTVVEGERDRITKPPFARMLAEAAPDARLVMLPRVGHLPQWEAPGAVAEEVESVARRADADDGVA
jgi:pimeloyl-ACP methyl ester carboxylesterase